MNAPAAAVVPSQSESGHPVIIEIACAGGERRCLSGWIVPDTNGLFAVDQRYEADLSDIPPSPAEWVINHLPTGWACGPRVLTCSRDFAIARAQRLYRELVAIGADLQSKVPEYITGKVNALPKEERVAFWNRVAGMQAAP